MKDKIDWSQLPLTVKGVTLHHINDAGAAGRDEYVSRPEPVTLTLTPEQAQALVEVCAAVGGRGPARLAIDHIEFILRQAGYAFVFSGNPDYRLEGSIRFTR